jgi:hypothetical protein
MSAEPLKDERGGTPTLRITYPDATILPVLEDRKRGDTVAGRGQVSSANFAPLKAIVASKLPGIVNHSLTINAATEG